MKILSLQLFILSFLILSSCNHTSISDIETGTKQETSITDLTKEEYDIFDLSIFEEHLISDYEFPEKHIEAFQELDFQGELLEVFEKINTITDEIDTLYRLGKDIDIPANQLLNLVGANDSLPSAARVDQFREKSLVNPTEILIVGRLEAGAGLIREALILAVENYNQLNLSVSFRLEFLRLQTASEIKRFTRFGLGRTYNNRTIHVR